MIWGYLQVADICWLDPTKEEHFLICAVSGRGMLIFSVSFPTKSPRMRAHTQDTIRPLAAFSLATHMGQGAPEHDMASSVLNSWSHVQRKSENCSPPIHQELALIIPPRSFIQAGSIVLSWEMEGYWMVKSSENPRLDMFSGVSWRDIEVIVMENKKMHWSIFRGDSSRVTD